MEYLPVFSPPQILAAKQIFYEHFRCVEIVYCLVNKRLRDRRPVLTHMPRQIHQGNYHHKLLLLLAQ